METQSQIERLAPKASTCDWCQSEMPIKAIVCTKCGKTRREIQSPRMIMLLFSIFTVIIGALYSYMLSNAAQNAGSALNDNTYFVIFTLAFIGCAGFCLYVVFHHFKEFKEVMKKYDK